MNPNPFLGVCLHWLGGLASGSFYVPFKAVRKWSWETYWLVGGFFGWIVCPWVLASLLTRNLVGVLEGQSGSTLWWTYFFGVLWGLGALTFGLTMRYLGMSLGMGVALGYCAAFGTLLPPLFKAFVPKVPVAETLAQIAMTRPGQITLAGVAICLVGIALAALAGLAKEREMPAEEKSRAIAEFSFRKGMLVATFSGIMSACFAFGLTAGNPIGDASRAAGTNPIWSGLPKLVLVVFGGFTTNFIWCLILNIRNRSAYEYISAAVRTTPPRAAAPTAVRTDGGERIPLARNYFFSALSGTTWYFQFFFYTMGETLMGKYGFASWTLHMASIIIFSTAWGWYFHEWRGASRRTHGLIGVGIGTLVLATIVVGYGAYLRAR
jgi:L-rhamnose-H+ transport protein